MAVAAICTATVIPAAQAFDPFFGLFGGGRPASPAPAPDFVSYDVLIDGDANSDLRDRLLSVSVLERLRISPPLAADGLIRRAAADIDGLTDALWAEGYLSGAIAVRLGTERIVFGQEDVAAATAAIEAEAGRRILQVTIEASVGPPYRLRTIRAEDSPTGREIPLFLPRGLRLKPGDLAAAPRIRAAGAALIERARDNGHPFARLAAIDATVDHRSQSVDLDFRLNAGPPARFGAVRFEGDPGFPQSVLRSFVYLKPGEPYAPRGVTETRAALGQIEALGGVRMAEASELDSEGRLDLTVKVSPRTPRVFGAALRYATRDGPSLRLYWTHRNLLGGAERLRVELDANWRSRTTDTERAIGDETTNFGGRLAASFLSPALYGSRMDFLAELRIEREKTETYVGEFALAAAALRWRFAPRKFLQFSLQLERGRSQGAGFRDTYTLAGLPVSFSWDGTDSTLDATRGWRVSGEAAPFFEELGGTVSMTRLRVEGAAFWSLDDDADTVLAVRLAAGSILGAELDRIPANRRFFAGGGGSVRGYAFRSLSPVSAEGLRTGGRSLFEASIEGRFRILPSISIVPFVDAGGSFSDTLPDFGEALRFGGGIGVRYHTGIGPVRLDLAVPFDRRPGEDSFAVYISIGQAF